MRKRRLLLISNSKLPDQEYLQHAEKPIQEFLGGKVGKVLFIPFAIVRRSYDQYAAIFRKRFEVMGYQFTSIHQVKHFHEAVSNAQAIVVGGGNTFNLLKKIYDADLMKVIRDAIDLGVPYIGWSAGANIACPTIQTTNDMPVVWPASTNALGLVPFQINPHYTEIVTPGFAGETRAERIAEFTALNRDVYVVGLPEGTMLKVEHMSVCLIGKRPAKVFYNDLPATEHGSAASLDFLLTSNTKPAVLNPELNLAL